MNLQYVRLVGYFVCIIQDQKRPCFFQYLVVLSSFMYLFPSFSIIRSPFTFIFVGVCVLRLSLKFQTVTHSKLSLNAG